MKLRKLLFAAGCVAGIAYIRNMVKNNPELLNSGLKGSKRNTLGTSRTAEDQVDLSSDESFPASDAPSWSPSVTDTRH